ncbi:MAG: hypothetical protein ACREBU_16995, partial [Nitrososphaera sp.]
MTFTAAKQLPQPTSSRFNAPCLYVCGMMLALTATAALLATNAQAQTAEPATAASAATTAPRYAVKELERAFSFMDANKDGKISREEAAGFRGVAKHFDEADSNKDNALS